MSEQKFLEDHIGQEVVVVMCIEHDFVVGGEVIDQRTAEQFKAVVTTPIDEFIDYCWLVAESKLYRFTNGEVTSITFYESM